MTYVIEEKLTIANPINFTTFKLSFIRIYKIIISNVQLSD
jgi:hypothetical protein